MHVDISQEQFCVKICRENATPQGHDNLFFFFFVRARAFEINFDIAPKRLYARMLTENATPQEQTKLAGADFVRACAVEMHMAMSQEPVSCRNLQGKMPETRWTQCLGKKTRHAM